MASPAPEEPRVKPTKPDEEAYKISLAQAEKEHTAAQEKLVRLISSSFFFFSSLLPVLFLVKTHWHPPASITPSRQRCPRAHYLLI